MVSKNRISGAIDPAAASPSKGDLVAQAKAQAESPLQKEFAMLLDVVEKVGQRVQELERWHGLYRAKFGQILPALKSQQDGLSREMVMFLHERLRRLDDASGGKAPSLTASHRKAIGRLIVSLSQEFALQGDLKMRSIHDLYSNESIADMDAAGVDGMLDLLDEMGVELPDAAGKLSASELQKAALKALQEKMTAQAEIEAQRKVRRDEKRAAKKQADPKEQAKLARTEQATQDAQSALKTIYRQLARQLHPDRANDDAQRLLNHDLMSEANTAYERKDLLALLKLQFKASQIDVSAMNSVAEDKLKSWIELLRAQFKDLAVENGELESQMFHEFRVPHGQRMTAEAIEQSLQSAKQDYDIALHTMRNDLEQIKNDAFLKRWAKANSKDLAQHDPMINEDILDAILMERAMNKAPRRSYKKRT